MPMSEYLRRQADTCQRIARGCFDLTSAERMRLLAAELRAKAAEIDQRDGVPNHVFDRSDSSDTTPRRR
ncbi:MAG: hypothetical protein FJX62_08565 [Alphaproteobacteria bacterium]|nr:hypothetical protein [Alphaproteobacteria bacterium]